MLRLNFEKKLKIKSLVAWSIFEGRMDQKQIINFVWPNNAILLLFYSNWKQEIKLEWPHINCLRGYMHSYCI